MQKIKHALVSLFILAAIVVPSISQAAVVINEVMYDVPGADDGREWVEIWNNGPEATDLTGWKFFEEGTNHALTPIGGSVIASGGFAIIVANPEKFAIDWHGTSFTIFDSSFSLKNTGESLSLKNNSGEMIDTVTYDPTLGAGGDGASLQLVGGSWLAASPTPGAVNGNTPIVPPNPESTTTPPIIPGGTGGSPTLSAHESPAPISSVAPSEPFKVGAGRPRLASVHSPVAFRVESTGTVPSAVRYQWSFGDGGSAVGEQVNHVYYFSGDYNIVLNAVGVGGELAVSRTTISVIQPTVSLGAISTDRIEVVNRSTRELNLGGWRITQGTNNFTFPADTIVAVGKSTLVPAANLGFPIISNLPLALTFPDNTLVLIKAPVPSREELEVLALQLRKLSAEVARLEISRRSISPVISTILRTSTTTISEQLDPTTSPPLSASIATISVPKTPGLFTRIKQWFGR